MRRTNCSPKRARLGLSAREDFRAERGGRDEGRFMTEGSSSILSIYYVPSNGFSTHRANTLSPARRHGKPASSS